MERVLVVDTGDSVPAKGDLKFITLLHPKSGNAQYIVAGDRLLELQKMRGSHSSWFKDNNVIEDGTLFLATPIDPLFVMIPLLEKNRKGSSGEGYYCTLEQILLENAEYPAYAELASCKYLNLELICDAKDIGAGMVYRLNDEAVLQWLCCKVEQLAEHLATKEHIVQGVVAAARAPSYRHVSSSDNKRKRNAFEADARKAAVGFLSEYTSEEWHVKLCEHYHITPQPSAKRVKSATKAAHLERRASAPGKLTGLFEDDLDESGIFNQATATPEKAKPAPSVSFANKRLQKVDSTGNKKISDFFRKK